MDFPPENLGTPLDSAEEEGTSDSNIYSDFKKTKHWHKRLVSQLIFRDKLDIIYSYFKLVEVGSGSDGSYQA